MILQLSIGFASGFLVGVVVFSHPFTRAVVAGLIAGIVIGGLMIDGVEAYVNWGATYLPGQMAKFAGFWIGLIAGIFTGARSWPSLLP